MHRKIVKQIEIEDNVCLRHQFKSDLHTSPKVHGKYIRCNNCVAF